MSPTATRVSFWAAAVSLAFALTAAGCGSDTDDAVRTDNPSGATEPAGPPAAAAPSGHDEPANHDEPASHDEPATHGHAEFDFGEPADASDADRTIEVDANDDFSFDPDDITITAGETVTFRVINTGVLPHDFTIGDAHIQDEHAAAMAAMPMGDMDHQDANALTVQGGETRDLTWTFTEPGELLIGCHIPGHFDAGMRGAITVSG